MNERDMKKVVRIAFHPDMSADIVKVIMLTLKEKFSVRRVRFSQNYDYYFAQEGIYSSHKSMLKFLKCKKEAIKIMLCKEDIYPDLNLFDYGIIFQKRCLWADDRILYMPFPNYLKTNGVQEPNIDQSQSEKNNEDIENFYKSFYEIFVQNKKNAARKPEGTWPDVLYSHFMKSLCGTKGDRWILKKLLK